MTNIYFGPVVSVMGLGGMAYGAMELSKAKSWQDAAIPAALIGIGAIAAYAGYITTEFSLQMTALSESKISLPKTVQSDSEPTIDQSGSEGKSSSINIFEAPKGTIFE